MCASHSGTDEHVAVLRGMHQKIGVGENDLMCGSHPPIHKETAMSLVSRGEKPTPIRHNCSGKHTGMIAFARYLNLPVSNYIDPDHPIQQRILQTFCEICDLQPKEVTIGTDGCSAPNFAVPLISTALAFARLCDPIDLPPERAKACRTITTAMTSHPRMVAGPDRFDTEIMEVTQGRMIVKGGAEGYLGIGLLPDNKKPTTPALGIAIKISDGDSKGRARPAVALEILRQFSAITSAELEALSHYGPVFPIHNWRQILVGEGRPCFKLNTS
jgi:L-asparaginase II